MATTRLLLQKHGVLFLIKNVIFLSFKIDLDTRITLLSFGDVVEIYILKENKASFHVVQRRF